MAGNLIGVVCLCMLGVGPASASANSGTGTGPAAIEPTEALKIRLVRPDLQLERLIALFKGARAPHPAAALAAWKRANRGLIGLGKPLEAATAALNPGMIRELRSLHEAKIGVGLDPGDGRPRWFVVAPHDDGALTALTTAITLTEGGPDAPYQDMTVDRLGRDGAPLALRGPGIVALAGSRADFPAALAAGRASSPQPTAESSGWVVEFNPDAIPATGSVANRRLIEAVRASGLQRINGKFGIEGESVEFTMNGEFDAALAELAQPAIEPRWLDWVPSSGVMAAGTMALDPSPQSWNAFFAWADRVERADPAKAQLAPLRTRLMLLSVVAGVQPEVDLFPNVRGLTAFVTPSPERLWEVESVVVALHVANADVAARLATRLIPRLAASILQRPVAAAQADGVLRLGMVAGRPLELIPRGATILFGWGDSALKSGLTAIEEAEHKVAAELSTTWGPALPQRVGALWLGRIGTPLLADAPPIVWLGRNESKGKSNGTRDVVRWSELRGVVKRMLERVPLDLSVLRRPGSQPVAP